MNCIEESRIHPPFAVSQHYASKGETHSCIRTNEYKLWESCLFDLKNDPYEKKDVSEEFPTQFKMLQKRMNDCLESRQVWEAKTHQMDDETIQDLKGLGYIK